MRVGRHVDGGGRREGKAPFTFLAGGEASSDGWKVCTTGSDPIHLPYLDFTR